MFLISNKLEQLEFKLEKIVGIQKHGRKVRKYFFLPGGRCGPGCTPGLNNEPNIFEIGLYGLYAF